MANVILLPTATQQAIPRGFLIGQALANGLQNVSATLMDYALKKQAQEHEDKVLAQQWQIAQQRAEASKMRIASIDRYRERLIDAQERGYLDRREYQQGHLALEQDKAQAMREHLANQDALGQVHAGIMAAAEQRRRENTGKSGGGRPGKPGNLEKIVEDRTRVANGQEPLYFKGASKADLDKLWSKYSEKAAPNPMTTAIGGLISDAVQGGGTSAPAPAPAAPPQGAPAAPNITLPQGWKVDIQP